jgi:serine/threonine protein kinase/TolB-like protein
MDSARWERIQSVFHRIADLPAAERSAALDGLCGDEAATRAEVLSLLEEETTGDSLLDRDVVHVAQQMLGDSLPGLPSRTFGPYRIHKVLGEGGMGVVYLAGRDDLGALVAIKVLRDAWLSPARRERFASEQRTLAQLNHPSIARLYDAGTWADGTPWFVMEFVDGVPLTEYCRVHNCGIEERLKLFRTVCEAAHYAHEHTVVHRDLKPSNILVKPDGSLRLLDFGIAKQFDPKETSVDQTGIRAMTPAYAAPEQIRGDRVGVATDVYALGVILYELLAGRLPFDLSHKTAAEVETIITTEEPAKPSTVARQNTGRSDRTRASWSDLDVLCLTAMRKDPPGRYRSAEAFIRDIDHYLQGESLEARPDTMPCKMGRFVRRNWKMVTSSAAVFAAMVGLAAALGWNRRGPAAVPRAATVAVLPFQNVGSDHSVDFLSLAIPDEVATTLSYTRSAAIRPFATTIKYTQPGLDLQKAGREMRVATIVTGHFLQAEGQLQITLEAVDVEGNRARWHETFTVPARNLIAMQSEISSRARLGLAALLGSSAPAGGTQPKSEEAYDLFLRSAAVPYDSGATGRGTQMLERAVGLDPGYAPAWVALAQRYYSAAHYTNGAPALMERFVSCLERAMALDPGSNAGGLIVYQSERGRLVEAYRHAQESMRRYPDNIAGEFGIAYVLRYAGLVDEAMQHCEKGHSLDPTNSGWRSCAVAFLLRGDYKRALDFIHLDAGSEWEQTLTMDALVRQGKEAEARQMRAAGQVRWAGFDLLWAKVQGRPIEGITVEPDEDCEANYFAAGHLAYCGRTRAALDMLKRAVDGNYCAYPAIEKDPLLASLRGEPEFAEIRNAARSCQEKFLKAIGR